MLRISSRLISGRLWQILGSGLILLSAPIASTLSFAAGPTDPIRFAVLADEKQAKGRYERLANVLGNKGLPLELKFYAPNDPGSLRTIIEHLAAGNLDVAGELTPYDFLRHKSDLKPFVRSLYAGKDYYYSVFVTRCENDNVRELSDLEGRTLALTNAESTASFIFPRAMFYDLGFKFEQRKIGADTNGSKTVYYRFYGNRENVANALVEEPDVAAAVLPEFAMPELEEVSKNCIRKLIDGRSRLIKNGVFVARPGLPDATVVRLANALIDVTENPPEGLFDESGSFTGWVSWEPGDYDGLASALEASSPTDIAMQRILLIIAALVFVASGVIAFRWIQKSNS